MLTLRGPATTYEIRPDLRSDGYKVGVWFGPFPTRADAERAAQEPMNAAYAQGCRDTLAQIIERLRNMGRAEVADTLKAEWLAAQGESGAG